MESIYRSASVVANICVYAAIDKAKPVAIIVPAEPALKKLAENNNIEGENLDDLVHNKRLNSIVLKELQSAGRQGGLQGIEIIDGVVLSDEEWTAANVSTSDLAKVMIRYLHRHRASLRQRKRSTAKSYNRSSRKILTRPMLVQTNTLYLFSRQICHSQMYVEE